MLFVRPTYSIAIQVLNVFCVLCFERLGVQISREWSAYTRRSKFLDVGNLLLIENSNQRLEINN